jgi:uncharacterized RDD family membrane protein YckC
MFCGNCGSTVDDAVCRVCGTPIETPVAFDAVSTVLAGWWSRVGATVIDSLILIVPTLMLDLLLGNLLGQIAAIGLQAAYMIRLQTQPDGQTLGNRAVQTRVRDSLTGQSISVRQAAIRWAVIAVYGVLEILSSTGSASLTATVSLLALADCLYPLMNPRKQTIHDRIARTIVVRA